jgi:hypothetical protein
MRCLIVLIGAASSAAFVALPATNGRSKIQLSAISKKPSSSSLNGWVPDLNQFCYGLPGCLPPAGQFDPLGFTNDISLDEMKRYREAEVTHGRVAMLAVTGFLIGEKFHPLFGLDGKEILAIDSLGEVRVVAPYFFEALVAAIGFVELGRAVKGWVNPFERGSPTVTTAFLEKNYYPGDIGFDPFGLKPSDPEMFAEMQTRELQNGRLAMLGIAGFVAQELVNRQPVLLFDFGL